MPTPPSSPAAYIRTVLVVADPSECRLLQPVVEDIVPKLQMKIVWIFFCTIFDTDSGGLSSSCNAAMILQFFWIGSDIQIQSQLMFGSNSKRS